MDIDIDISAKKESNVVLQHGDEYGNENEGRSMNPRVVGIDTDTSLHYFTLFYSLYYSLSSDAHLNSHQQGTHRQ